MSFPHIFLVGFSYLGQPSHLKNSHLAFRSLCGKDLHTWLNVLEQEGMKISSKTPDRSGNLLKSDAELGTCGMGTAFDDL